MPVSYTHLPARQIATNAGEDGSVIVGKILEKDQYAYGFDAQNGEYVNLVSKGIIDPVSYTHLDVYKRQPQCPTICRTARGRPSSDRSG